MALITQFSESDKSSYQVHGPTNCRYSIFAKEGGKYLQLDTYGSSGPQEPEKISQSIQLDRQAAGIVKRLIEKAFPDLE